MKTVKYFLSILFTFLSLTALKAKQIADNDEVAMADILRESGKIYVVVACLLLIFAGIIVFLVLLERKLNKLEKRLSQASK